MSRKEPKAEEKVWWARGGDIAKMGPYATYEEAARALMTTKGVPIDGAFVWPEGGG